MQSLYEKKRTGIKKRVDSRLTSITILSISHISICSREEWREASRKMPPSPPPTSSTWGKKVWKEVLYPKTRLKVSTWTKSIYMPEDSEIVEGEETFLGLGMEQRARWVSISWYTNSSFSESWRYPSKITIFPDVADCKHKQQVIVISIGKCMIPGGE